MKTLTVLIMAFVIGCAGGSSDFQVPEEAIGQWSYLVTSSNIGDTRFMTYKFIDIYSDNTISIYYYMMSEEWNSYASKWYLGDVDSCVVLTDGELDGNMTLKYQNYKEEKIEIKITPDSGDLIVRTSNIDDEREYVDKYVRSEIATSCLDLE